jgi:hypothetical protein
MITSTAVAIWIRGRRRSDAHSSFEASLCAAAGNDDSLYLGRKPSFTSNSDAVGVARIAKETGVSRQTIYRIKGVAPGAAVGHAPLLRAPQ